MNTDKTEPQGSSIAPSGSRYYVDHRKKSVWVPNLKVGSRTIDRAIGEYVNGELFRRPKEMVKEYLDYGYKLVMVTRHPLDRLRSYWDAEIPKKEHETFAALVDAMLSGWKNPHTTPQAELIEGLKYPDLCFDISELTPRWEELAACFSWPLPIELRNVSPRHNPLPSYRRAELIEYYRKDFETFGYSPDNA